MSIFTPDTSIQLSGNSSLTKTYNTKDNPNLSFHSRAGIYNSADNTIKFFTNNTDALTINSSQQVICDGSLITNIAWGNINGKPSFFDGTWNSLSGKPTNFQSDWLTTITNKPTLFDGTWTSLSGKPTLFDGTWTSLSGKPTLFDGTWTSLSGKPTLFSGNYNDLTNKTFINSGTDIYNNNTGNVGIGLTNPTSKLHVKGNLKCDFVFTTNLTSIGNLFATKPPWGVYFAEDWSGTTLPDSSGNGRDATTSGTITKTTASGNGATAPITYISGDTSATISFPTGSIPTAFTILALTRYNGGTRRRVLQSRTSGINWFLGHLSGLRGLAYFVNNYYTDGAGIAGSQDDWLTSIAKSSGTIPTNILMNGIQRGGGTPNTTGGYELGVNLGITSQTSDWALSTVMIWDSALTDSEMVLLNTTIDNYKSTGNQLIYELSKMFFTSEIYSTNNFYFNREIFKNNINISNIFVSSNVHSNTSNFLYNQIGTGVNLTNYFTKDQTSNIFITSNVIQNSTNLINFNNITGKPTNFQSDWLTTITNKPTLFDGTWTSLSGKPTLATVATSGLYNDLSGKPTNFQADWNSTVINRPDALVNISNIFPTSNVIQNATNLISFNNLTNKPTYYQADWNTTVMNKPAFFSYINNYDYLVNTPFINSGIDIFTNNQGNTTIGNVSSISTVNGTIYQVINDNNSNYCVFLQSGSITFPQNTVCDILVVGGGGAGAYRHSAGGGAGAVIYDTNITLNAGTYSITIGNGGAMANNSYPSYGGVGGDSEILVSSSILYRAKGGGGALGWTDRGTALSGGSGGGTTGNNRSLQTVGAAVNTNIINGVGGFVRGNAGGKGDGGGTNAAEWSGGGGGGAGEVGQDSTLDQNTNTNAGRGGNGVQISITGTATYYGGGGGGGISNGSSGNPGVGGLGGGGAGSKGSATATSGIPNTGGGGGGGGYKYDPDTNGIGGTGGSGIVIIRYKIPNLIVKNNLAVSGDLILDNGLILNKTTGKSLILGTENAERMRIANNGNVGIGTINPQYKLHINNGSLYIGDQTATAVVNDNGYKLIFDNSMTNSGANYGNKIVLHNNGNAYISGIGIELGGTVFSTWTSASHKFYNGTSSTTGGTLRATIGDTTNFYNNVNINATNNSYAKLNVNGVVNFHGGNPYGVPNNYMTAGSLTIGDGSIDYGGTNGWTTNTAGLLMECLNNTEICIHDWGNYLGSVMYYYGATKSISYGREKGNGHPNAHYFFCNDKFECYFANAAGGWNYLSITPTSLWGDGLSTASDQAGTKYLTMRNIMLQFPHIVPNSVGGTAGIRFGRAGGIASGTWYEIGTYSDGTFRITKEANTGTGIKIYNSGNDMTIGTSIGIGVDASYRLHVAAGSGGSGTTNFRYFNAGTAISYGSTYFTDVCAYFASTIFSSSWIASSSDIRIKKEIEDINDDTALQMVLAIQPKTYKYIDDIRKGDKKVYGFIAQQIKEVIPEAVATDNKEIIPNIYKLYDVSGDTITTDDDLTSKLNVGDKIEYLLEKSENKEYCKVLEISSTQIKIDKTIGENDNKIFIFGKEIDDFHTISKEYIFTLNVCATQELHRIIKSQEQRISDLEAKLNQLLERLN